MSGLMGLFYLDGSCVDGADLWQMSDSLKHRGPDDTNIWVDGPIGFGHRMLWTTPESLIEKLPFVNQQNNLVITSDARIDNREQLIFALQFKNCPPEKITDSQLILAAYEKWGELCPEYLLGDFAFAIWDKHKQSLFCARDHFGVKPFYYYRSHRIFVFASEIKALFCLSQVPRRLNEVRIGDYLALMMEDQVSTSYQDILRLPPAHSMMVNQSAICNRQYWCLDKHREIKLPSNSAYSEEFCKIFTEAVRCRLRSAFPVVSHLSGGLDSSAVTCVARELLTEMNAGQLHTISSIFDKITECDERPHINEVLNQGQGGLIPHYVHGDEFGPLSNIDEIFQYEDEALLGPSHFYPWIVNRTIKELGLRISLDGFDGDTTVSHGMFRLTELAHQGKWQTFVQEVKAVAQNSKVSPYAVFRTHGLPYLRQQAKQWRWIKFFKAVQLIHKYFGASRKRLILNHGLKPLFLEIAELWPWRKLRKPLSSVVSRMPLVNKNFVQRISLDERIQQLQGPDESPLTVKEEHWRSLTQGLLAYTLEQMDQYAAAFSIEARHPFMDKRLIEFCLALPPEQKLYQGWGRMVMRRALEGILPEKIQWRRDKADLTPNFLDGLLNRNRQLLEEVMFHKLKNIENYIDIEYLQEAYHHLRSENSKVCHEDTAIILWRVIILALWFDHKQVLP